jgi:hypothetical protein
MVSCATQWCPQNGAALHGISNFNLPACPHRHPEQETNNHITIDLAAAHTEQESFQSPGAVFSPLVQFTK